MSERKWIYCSLRSHQSDSRCVSHRGTRFSDFRYNWQSPLAPDPGSDFWGCSCFAFFFFLSSFSKLKTWGNFRAPNPPRSIDLERVFATYKTWVCLTATYSLFSAPWAKDARRLLPQYSVQGKSKPQRRASRQLVWMTTSPAAEEFEAAREGSCKGAPGISCAMCESLCWDTAAIPPPTPAWLVLSPGLQISKWLAASSQFSYIPSIFHLISAKSQWLF